VGSFRGETRENADTMVEKLPERMGTAFPLFKNTLWTALRTIFRPKCTRLQDFAHKISKLFPGGIPRTSEIAPGVWTQTPIFTCLARVSIVPGLRNENRFKSIKVRFTIAHMRLRGAVCHIQGWRSVVAVAQARALADFGLQPYSRI